MDDMVFFMVVTILIAGFEFLLALVIAVKLSDMLDLDMGAGGRFAGDIFAAMIVWYFGHALESAGNFFEWRAQIIKQYARSDISDIIDQGRTLEYIGQMAVSKLGMNTVLAAIAINLLVWLICNHRHHILDLIFRGGK